MPSQLAHDVVGFALDYTGKTVDSIKSKPGLLNNIVTKVEGPVAKTLEHRAVKTVLKVGDQVLTTVDGTIDKALTSTYYKSGEAYVKSTYSNRIVPATNTVTTTVTTTTNRVTTPIVNVYTGVLAFADKQVEFYLPDGEASDKALPLTVVGVTTKATRRTVRKVGAVRKMTVARISKANKSARATIKFAFEQAKPANVKKNAAKAYVKTLSATDKAVDKYLPGNDDLVAKGPVTLVTKVSKRGAKHTIASIKMAATAVKNSPATFKKVVASALKSARAQVARVQDMTVSIKFKAYDTFTPYIESALTKSLALVKVADSLLLKYPMTTNVRNFAVAKYGAILAPVVNKYIALPSARPTEHMIPEVMAQATATDEEEDVKASVSFASEQSEEEAESPPATEGKKKKSKKNKKKAAAADDENAYC